MNLPGVKSAEEWVFKAKTVNVVEGHGDYSIYSILTEDYAKAIQLDAYTAGMRRAMEIVDSGHFLSRESPEYKWACSLSKAIEASIPKP